MKEILTLNGAWKLYYAPEAPGITLSLDEIRSMACIDAEVPGNVELDLCRAGLEPDPFYAENLYRFRKYEFYCWQFERDFDVPETDVPCALRFEGLNCFATVYVNGVKLGETHNAFIAHEFDVTDVLNYGGKNHIIVRIASAVNRMRGEDFPANIRSDEYARLRMPASSFGWDIMGRFLSAGMWRGVSIVEKPATRLDEIYIATKAVRADGSAEVHVHFTWKTDAPVLDGFEMEICGECGESTFNKRFVTWFVAGETDIRVPNAKLWWPHGYGEAALYNVTVRLFKDGALADERTQRIGIRRIELAHELKGGDDGEFKVIVNGTPILCKGSNHVPLDALHSRDAARTDAALALYRDVGVNIIRCWGGNVYEDHHFFDLCDEAGILVWQDFAMACGCYPQDEAFAKEIEYEAACVVKKLRNHPSILLWAGDNECDEGVIEAGYPTYSNRFNAVTRETLPRVVRMHDPYRLFLPSSPYIPEGIARYDVPEQHNWGARAYFKDDFYKHSRAHFISECGYHGCPAVSSLKKYIPESELGSWLNNPVWDAHNTDYLPFGARGYNRIGLMQDQVDILFGSVPTDLEQFARLSQIVQAEAKKFFVERTRIKKWRRTGVIWWNLLDGWPQISDAVVDYYYAKKLAYYYLKRVSEPIAVLMDEQRDWSHDVILSNDSRTDALVRWTVRNGDTDEVLLLGETFSRANENITLGALRELPGRQNLYLLTWEIGEKQFGNHYISGFPAYDAEKMLAWTDKIAQLPEAFDWEV